MVEFVYKNMYMHISEVCLHELSWPIFGMDDQTKRVTHLCTHLYVFINPNIRIFFVKTCFLNNVFNCHISLDSRELQIVPGRKSGALPGCLYITIYTIAFHLSVEVYMHKEREKRGSSERIIVLVKLIPPM